MGKVSDAGHPHIVRVYDAGIFNGQPFIAMELLDGQDLYDAVHTNTDPLMPLRATLQTLSALEFIHAMHVVHRDVKPGNIRITTNQGAKLMDFGIAKELNSCRGITTRYGVDALGTEAYMAPEQLASLVAPKDRDVTGEVNHLTDLWAMGKTLHFGLTGNHAIPKTSTTGERYNALYRFVPSPPTQSGLYADCYPFLSRLMARKREDRYQDAACASRDLQQILDCHDTRTRSYPDLPTMITHLVTGAPVEDVLRPSCMLLRPDVYTDLTEILSGGQATPTCPSSSSPEDPATPSGSAATLVWRWSSAIRAYRAIIWIS